MAAPSWLATQPPTPINTFSPFFLSDFQRPIWLKTFSWAFSRIEQVLTRITSASSAIVVSSMPSDAASTSAILAESYSFIWQPWVSMKSFFERMVDSGDVADAAIAASGVCWVMQVSGARC